MFRRLLAAGLIGGIAGGLIVAGLQAALLTPLILEAEAFEVGGGHGGHDDLWKRHGASAVVTIAVATGYGWMLLAAMHARGAAIGPRSVLSWAVAGFVATGLAPALGLPPEAPGAASGSLLARQLWWAGTALATAFGLALLAWGRGAIYVALGLGILALPHLIGAPQAVATASPVPAELAAAFAARSLALQALIWVLPAALAGAWYARLAGRDEEP